MNPPVQQLKFMAQQNNPLLKQFGTGRITHNTFSPRQQIQNINAPVPALNIISTAKQSFKQFAYAYTKNRCLILSTVRTETKTPRTRGHALKAKRTLQIQNINAPVPTLNVINTANQPFELLAHKYTNDRHLILTVQYSRKLRGS